MMHEILNKPNKIKKMKCYYHEDNRDISEYVFWCTDTRRHARKKQDIDLWECKKCKEHHKRQIDRENRIREHNEKQYQESRKRYNIRYEKKLEKLEKSRKENIWDDEVRHELSIGLKLNSDQRYLYKEKIPKQVLQLKRATMRLERLIKNIKENHKTKKELEKEAIKKLKRPLVECRKHGALFLKDVIKGGKSRWTGEQRYKCRQCMSDLHRDYYRRRKDYVLMKHAEYRKNFPEKRKETKIKSWRKHHGKENEFIQSSEKV